MAMEEKCFTFMWKLENVNYSLPDNPTISSPDFVVDSIDESKWKLGLYPRGDKDSRNFVSFYLFRHKDNKGNDKVTIRFELAFLAQDGSVLKFIKAPITEFPKEGLGYAEFQKREEVFVTKRSLYLPQDTLTARCRIWKSDGEMAEDVLCFARTRIGVEKRSHSWKVESFSTLQYGQKYTYEVKSLDHAKQLISVNLSLSEGLGSEETICFEINLQDQTIKFTTLLLSLVDVYGNRIECNRDEFQFNNQSKSKQFKFFFTKSKLMEMKNSYIPEDNLTLHFKWVFSKGIVSHAIEDVQYGCNSTEDNSHNVSNNQKSIPLSYPWNDNLKSLYDKNSLCDVKLKTSTHEFNAHKVILSASSSVFDTMFSSDMKEKNCNGVSIEDLCDDTISHMLEYIYTARIDNLTWEKASLLYEAADKYAIFSLKTICSTYLKDNLSPTNVCEVLLLSDLHFDDDFKSPVQDYILKHLNETVKTVEWKQLMATNPTLAAETVCLPYK